MDPRTGEIIQRPDGMSDEDWQKLCQERGLISMTQEQLADRFRSNHRSKFVPAGPPNRHERRAAASRARRGA